MKRRLVIAVLLGVAALAWGCASGSGAGGLTAKDELELGYKAARRGYWQEALYRFERADREQPQSPEVLNNMAVALEAVGRYDEAKAVYERALGIAPNDRNLRRNKQLFGEFYATYVAPPEGKKDKESTDESPRR